MKINTYHSIYGELLYMKKMLTIRNGYSIDSLMFLLLLSFYFGRFNIDIGFSLKPFMIVTAILGLLYLKRLRFYKMLNFEIILIIFVLYHSLTAIGFEYPNYSIRFIILYIIIFIYYCIVRGAINNIPIYRIEKLISISGFIAMGASLAYYLLGIISSNMIFRGNELNYYGLLIDRSVPRLTGTISTDPNIFVYYATLYFFYTITHLESKYNKLGFTLSSILIFLTFSRGGLISIFLGLFLLLITKKKLNLRLKPFLIITLIILMFMFFGKESEYVQYSIMRFQNLTIDGGSGRIYLWGNALKIFFDNPLGIGINSVIPYNLKYFGSGNYVHNTFIEVLLETGIIGFAMFILFWLLIIISSIKIMKIRNESKYLFLTLVAMMLQMNFLSILYFDIFYFTIILVSKYINSYEYETKQINVKD